jgi:hypothetical protein
MKTLTTEVKETLNRNLQILDNIVTAKVRNIVSQQLDTFKGFLTDAMTKQNFAFAKQFINLINIHLPLFYHFARIIWNAYPVHKH